MPQDILALDSRVCPERSRTAPWTDYCRTDGIHVGPFGIERINPLVGEAIILLRDRAELLEEAAQADSSPRKEWLHGIPIAIKDLSNCQGIPTTMGGSPLPLFQDFVPVSSEPFVQRLIDAGAIVIGKTNTPEGGRGSRTYNRLGRTCI